MSFGCMMFGLERSGSVSVFGVFFFFKQKTAYEMRISDWSSDVCSSDLSEAMKCVAMPSVTQSAPPIAPAKFVEHVLHAAATEQFGGERMAFACRDRQSVV